MTNAYFACADFRIIDIETKNGLFQFLPKKCVRDAELA